MFAKVSQLDTDFIDLQLAPASPGDSEPQYARLQGLEGFAGGLQSEPTGTGIQCEFQRAFIEALRLVFGAVVLEAEGKSQLGKTKVAYTQGDDSLVVDLRTEKLTSPRLSVDMNTVAVSAKVEFHDVDLQVNGAKGEIFTGMCRLTEFSVVLGKSVEIQAMCLTATKLRIGWGAPEFELEAEQLNSPQLDLIIDGVKNSVFDIEALQLSVQDADWSIRDVKCESVELAAQFSDKFDLDEEGKSASSPANVPHDKRPLFDWSLLDRLSGQVDVDVDVNLRVPVIEHRQARHELRLEVRNGKLNLRQIESGLSTLESALLDFSVREDDLVLEVGVPFLPTRGLGKPIMTFPLTPQETKWAKGHWAKIQTLAHPQFATESSEPESDKALPAASSNQPSSDETALAVREEEESEGPVSLEHLEFSGLRAQLSLAAPLKARAAVLRSLEFEALNVEGGLVYGGAGTVTGSVKGVALEVDDFPLGETLFDLTRVRADGESAFEVEFVAGLPRTLRMKLRRVGAARIDFGSYARDHRFEN